MAAGKPKNWQHKATSSRRDRKQTALSESPRSSSVGQLHSLGRSALHVTKNGQHSGYHMKPPYGVHPQGQARAGKHSAAGTRQAARGSLHLRCKQTHVLDRCTGSTARPRATASVPCCAATLKPRPSPCVHA
jgi:hypothetical protein